MSDCHTWSSKIKRKLHVLNSKGAVPIQLLWFITVIYEAKRGSMNESLQVLLFSEVKCLKAKNVNLRATAFLHCLDQMPAKC